MNASKDKLCLPGRIVWPECKLRHVDTAFGVDVEVLRDGGRYRARRARR